MAAPTFPPHTKSETTPRPNNHRLRSPAPPSAGQIIFRLLCHVHTAGGVIGSSGSVIRHLETLTGSKIRLEDGVHSCNERVVNVIGDGVAEKKTIIIGEDEFADVSRAQEGLIRVFEVEANEDVCNQLVVCRLLAPTGQIGAVMGKGGKIVDGIRTSTGAKIRVFKKEQIPACAGDEEELIQIMGGVVAVKKALLAISRCLQSRALEEEAHGHENLHADLNPKISPNGTSLHGTAFEHHSVDHALSADVEKILNLDEDGSKRKVVFRFLCSNGIAGGVIGKSANIVKSLENETGASIKFTSPVSGSNQRVAIISSLEIPDPLYSPAQVAVIRVFARCIEVFLDQRVVSRSGNRDSVSARILVTSSQLSCLLDDSKRVASDISTASGAKIQLMGADLLPNCAGVDDNVVQITGDYENVKSALFQLTGRLRENFFSKMGPIGGVGRHRSYEAIPSSSPDDSSLASSTQLEQFSGLPYIDELDHLGFVQANSRESIPRPVDSAQGLTTIRNWHKHESVVGNEEPKNKLEFVVSKEMFDFFYGDDNRSKLARLNEISGASVILQDPCPGESRKVIISGSLECIQNAKSLLQAFI